MSLLALIAAVGIASADPYRMNDVGGELDLPKVWEVLNWADWELKAKRPDGMLFKLWLTPFQADLNEANAKAWAAMYADRLRDEGLKEVEATEVEVRTVGERQVAWVALAFEVDARTDGVAYMAAIPSDGQMIHMRLLTSKQNAKKARAELEGFLTSLKLDKEALHAASQEVKTEAGFAATLPEGWRTPFAKEMDKVRSISGKVGEDLKADDCWVAIHPPAVGDPDLIFACKSQVYLGPVDEFSFVGVEAEVHEKFFGRSEKPVPTAEEVQVGDRDGFYYRPPVGGHPVRLAIGPYDGGLMLMWGFAGGLDGAGMDAAMQSILPTVQFTGPDGGKPIISADKWASYYISYRPTSPLVWGPALVLLALVGGGVMMARRASAARMDDD